MTERREKMTDFAPKQRAALMVSKTPLTNVVWTGGQVARFEVLLELTKLDAAALARVGTADGALWAVTKMFKKRIQVEQRCALTVVVVVVAVVAAAATAVVITVVVVVVVVGRSTAGRAVLAGHQQGSHLLLQG